MKTKNELVNEKKKVEEKIKTLAEDWSYLTQKSKTLSTLIENYDLLQKSLKEN